MKSDFVLTCFSVISFFGVKQWKTSSIASDLRISCAFTVRLIMLPTCPDTIFAVCMLLLSWHTLY